MNSAARLRFRVITGVLFLLLFSNLSAGDKINFGNFNTVFKISVNDNRASFNVYNGFVAYDTDDNSWSFDWKSNTQKVNCVNLGTTSGWPLWLPNIGYSTILCSDDVDPAYFVVGQVNEVGRPEGCLLADSYAQKTYKFDTDQIRTMKISGSTAWMGSCKGLYRLDLNDGRLRKYVIMPAFVNPVGAVEFTDAVFFADMDYGVYRLDKTTGEISTVIATSEYTDARSEKISVMTHADGRLFAFSRFFTCAGTVLNNEKGRLHIYDVKTKELQSIEVKTVYVDNTVQSGGKILFYGYFQHDEEGEEPSFFGGVFSYDIKSGELIHVTNMPIFAMWPSGEGYGTYSYSHDWDIGGIRSVEGYLDAKTLKHKPTAVKHFSNATDDKKVEMLANTTGWFSDPVPENVIFEKQFFSQEKSNFVVSYRFEFRDLNYKRRPQYVEMLSKFSVKPAVVTVADRKAEIIKY